LTAPAPSNDSGGDRRRRCGLAEAEDSPYRHEEAVHAEPQSFIEPMELAPGLLFVAGYLDLAGQRALYAEVERALALSPLYRPRMPRSGHPFSVRMTNCGSLGWVSDQNGYRYQASHPETGEPWPPIPELALFAWRELGAYPHPPQACLINFYDAEARLGLHQDREEDDLEAPVVSLSLGDTGLFRFGGRTRRDPTRRIELQSGDALVLGGPSRFCFHGIDRIRFGSSSLLPGGGRINLTLRRVSRPSA
jgi:alkylated DNA repair protein (DNA oxidative demethylase)